MVSKGTNKNNSQDQTDSDTDGRGGKGKGGGGYIPSFDELIAVTPEEAEIARCAKDALFAQRVSLKSQGQKVAALDKKQEMRKRLSDPGLGNEIGNSNLEEHPELPEMGGAFDDLVLPEIEAEAAARNNPELRNALRARLGMGMSAEAIRYDLENKNKQKMRLSQRPAPEAKPEYVFRPASPSPRPRPY